MSPLERLFLLEIEFQRRLRCEASDLADPSSLHTSYALQAGYEPLLRGLSGIGRDEINSTKDKLLLAGDPRDVLAAYHSILQLCGLPPVQGID